MKALPGELRTAEPLDESTKKLEGGEKATFEAAL